MLLSIVLWMNNWKDLITGVCVALHCHSAFSGASSSERSDQNSLHSRQPCLYCHGRGATVCVQCKGHLSDHKYCQCWPPLAGSASATILEPAERIVLWSKLMGMCPSYNGVLSLVALELNQSTKSNYYTTEKKSQVNFRSIITCQTRGLTNIRKSRRCRVVLLPRRKNNSVRASKSQTSR